MSGAEYFIASFWPLDDLISVNKKKSKKHLGSNLLVVWGEVGEDFNHF